MPICLDTIILHCTCLPCFFSAFKHCASVCFLVESINLDPNLQCSNNNFICEQNEQASNNNELMY